MGYRWVSKGVLMRIRSPGGGLKAPKQAQGKEDRKATKVRGTQEWKRVASAYGGCSGKFFLTEEDLLPQP